MKKLYTLSLMLVGALSFAQTPIITGIMDGPCTGGLPKVLEIYANGTVDFTMYSLQNQTNANTTWGGTLDLTPFGTRTNAFVYVLVTSSTSTPNLPLATAEFSFITTTNSLESGVMNLNGDDRIRLINTASQAVIDQFGVTDVDGITGSGASTVYATWAWQDTYAYRNNGTGPDAGFVEANWTIADPDFLDNKGTCMDAANPALSTIVPFGTFSAPASTKNFDAISGLKLFPNPLSGNVLNVTSNSSADKTIAVYDVLGKNVLNAKVTNETVNVSALNSGVYIVKITEEGKTATRKLVVK